MASDDDKTVFGQNLPSGDGERPQRRNIAPTRPMPKGQPNPADRTVIGGAPQQPPPQQPVQQQPPPQQPAQQPPQQQPPQQSPYGQSGRSAPSTRIHRPLEEDTWLSGNFQPDPQQGNPQQTYNATPQYNPQGYQPNVVRPQGTGAELFPDIPQEQQETFQREVPRISLQDALRTTGVDKAGASNPLVASASNLLILLGRLRTGLVEMQSQLLLDHVSREIELFERNAFDRNVPPADVEDGKYALCAAADDIVQNLPGADRGQWLQYGMCARFFQDRSSGVNFFVRLDSAMKAPGQRFNVLELMLICMSLGFEGQYRASGNGGLELGRVRAALYETLRRVQPRADDDISVRWLGGPLSGTRRGGGIPVWIIGSVAAAMLVTLFITLSALLARQATAAEDGLRFLHREQPALEIVRTIPADATPDPLPVSTTPQRDQVAELTEFLRPEIESGEISAIGRYNNGFIYIRLGDTLKFRSGSATLDSEFDDLAARLAAAANSETGEIRIVGHTDSIPPGRSNPFRTNDALSLARAETVRDVILPLIEVPDRVTVQGLGANQPIDVNATPEGRANNRRVEILIQRLAPTAGVDTPLESQPGGGDQ